MHKCLLRAMIFWSSGYLDMTLVLMHVGIMMNKDVTAIIVTVVSKARTGDLH